MEKGNITYQYTEEYTERYWIERQESFMNKMRQSEGFLSMCHALPPYAVIVVSGSFKKVGVDRFYYVEQKLLENSFTPILPYMCYRVMPYISSCNKNHYMSPCTQTQISFLKKIMISDGLFAVNVGGYIGESTALEIEFARANGKPVFMLEKEVSQ